MDVLRAGYRRAGVGVAMTAIAAWDTGRMAELNQVLGWNAFGNP